MTAEKCSQSHLLTRLEANSRRLVQRQRTSDGRVLLVYSAVNYMQLATSDIRDSDTAVCQVLWRLVVQTPVDCDGELEPDSICHIEPVQVGM